MTDRKQWSRMRLAQIVTGVCVVLITGCGQFFTKESSSSSSGTSGNNLYVANPASTTDTIAGFAIGTSTLTALTNSPYAGATGASSVALTHDNKYFYEGTTGSGIFLYTVNTDGSLTLANSGVAVASGLSVTAMAVDPSNTWLIVVDQLTQQVLSYSINASTGLLTNTTANRAGLDAGSSNRLVITPSTTNGQFIYVSLATGGVDILTFNSTSGAVVKVGNLAPKTATTGADYGVATDPNGTYLFVAETGLSNNLGLRQLTIGTNGALTETAASPFVTGAGPRAVLVDTTGSYVYVTNRTDGTITAYALTTAGALSTITGSPFAAGTNPVDIVEDNTKTYIAVANNGGSPDLQLYKLDSTTAGKLDPVATATTGTDPTDPVAIAASH